MAPNGSWAQDRQVVLARLDMLQQGVTEVKSDLRLIDEKLDSTRECLAGVRVQAGLAGGLTGLLTALAVALREIWAR